LTTFLQLLIHGIQLGSVYALIALGYTMVYGIIRLINFAHGDFLMLGAFVGYFAITVLDLGFVPVMLISMVTVGIIGVIVERIAYKPLRNKPRLSSLITAIGVSIFIQNFCRALPAIGPAPRPFPRLLPLVNYEFLGITISSIQIVMILLAFGLMLLLQILTTRTAIGRRMRAVANDKDAAALMGINIDNTISVTFFIGASLAAAGGILYATTYPMIDVYMGSVLGLRAFTAAVLGGIGYMPGAMLGGLIMGIAEVLATSINADLGYGISFIILIIILLVKPAGLLGKYTVEKV